MSKTKFPPSVPWNFKEELYEKLRDPEYASFYLNEAFLDDDEIVLKTAIGSVIRANGVVKVAKTAGINRCTVFKTLKPETRTSFTTMHRLLLACGLKFSTQPVLETTKKKSKRAVRSSL
jgi:probable addiction module antidote protein